MFLSLCALACLATRADYDELVEHLKDIDGDLYINVDYGGDDCNDHDEEVNPGQEEVPYDQVDNDCDLSTPDEDLDGDGFDHDVDCDDEDPSTHPGATEVWYDGVDQDCDDNDLDQDEDGYDLAQDCDDTDPNAAPGLPETCDLADNDCDDRVDEGVDQWFPDQDGDGWGVTEEGLQTCTPPSDYVSQGGDCDDDSPAVHPEAEEVCNDLLDNDCDESYGSCGWAPERALDDADAQITGLEGGDMAGWVLDAATDLTGDGVRDLVVGAPGTTEGGNVQGAIYVLAGPITGEISLGDAVAVIRGDPEGGSVPLGQDLVTLAGHGSAPAVLLVVTTSGQAASFELPLAGDLVLDDGDAIYMDGEFKFANSTFAAGDVDGNLSTDFILGHSAASTGEVTQHGAARLFLRDENGFVDDQDPAATWIGEAEGDLLGEEGGAADVNGDGFTDVFIGAAGSDEAFEDGGAVYLFFGPDPASSLADADGLRLGEAAGDGCGTALQPGGDLDGDGLDDVLLGAPFSDRGVSDGGALYVVTDFGILAAASASTADAMILGASDGDYLGFTTAGNVDLDGDGYTDLAVAIPRYDTTESDVGSACVFLTYSSGVSGLDACDVLLVGTERSGYASADLVGGDLNGDGLDDLALGVSHPSEGSAGPPGSVSLFLGAGY